MDETPQEIPQPVQSSQDTVFNGSIGPADQSVLLEFLRKNPNITGVAQIIAGTNVTVSPVGGTGAVTVSAAVPASSIARDGSSTGSALGGATSFTIGHTTSGANRLLITAIEGHIVPTDVITAVTYGGVAMTRLSSHINFGATSESFWIYYLLAPALGANNIVITCSSNPGAGGGGLYVANASYNGVLQTGFPENQGDNSNGGSALQQFPPAAGSGNPYEWGIGICGGQNTPLALQAASGNGSVTNIFASTIRCFIADTNGTINPAAALTTGVSSGGGATFCYSIFIEHA